MLARVRNNFRTRSPPASSPKAFQEVLHRCHGDGLLMSLWPGHGAGGGAQELPTRRPHPRCLPGRLSSSALFRISTETTGHLWGPRVTALQLCPGNLGRRLEEGRGQN